LINPFLYAGGGDFESIATTTVSGTATTEVTFSNIPSTYQHLQVRGIVKRYDNSNGTYLGVRVNSDTGTNYASHYLSGQGSTTYAGALTSSDTGLNYNANASARTVPGSTTAELFGAFVYDILDYASTSKNKTGRGFIGFDANGSGTVQVSSGVWLSTSAITSLTLRIGGDTFYAPSTFALYGVKAP
jgi:hypothetical protein